MTTDTAPAMRHWQHCLPEDAADAFDALLIGRMDFGQGPTPVLLHRGQVLDLSASAATVSELLEALAPGAAPEGVHVASIAQVAANARVRLLAPLDLQCIKAAGVTFAVSTLERVIEERAGGDAARANAIRGALAVRMGGDLRSVKPGSEQAQRLKAALQADGLWSQYLEVAIGPDAEVFTKAPVLSAVGAGAEIGIRPDSNWNNPEPELVLVCDSRGRVRGAALGNDVNLRDIEGRSALLLGKAKDNNASCAIGPFLRLLDQRFTLDDLRGCTVRLQVCGGDGFELAADSSMREISRDPLDLVEQTMGRNHCYPDGFALFLGTLFAPVKDRGAPGKGFTHQVGDMVRIASERLGLLENRVVHCEQAPPWSFGIAALMRNLAGRGLIKSSTD